MFGYRRDLYRSYRHTLTYELRSVDSYYFFFLKLVGTISLLT